jgi:hypothetical protein
MELEYKIVSAENRQECERQVIESISQGWEPQGGICMFICPPENVFYSQAMTRKLWNKLPIEIKEEMAINVS